jgi:hypothetical protein
MIYEFWFCGSETDVEFVLKVVEEKGEASWLGVAVCVELLWLL